MEEKQKKVLFIGIGVTLLFGLILFVFNSLEKNTGKQLVKEVLQNTVSSPDRINIPIQEPTQQAKPIAFEPFEKWASYKSKTMGIEIRYPHELFLNTENPNKIIFDYLNPKDPEQTKEYATLAEMRISLESESSTKIIGKVVAEKRLNFKQEKIILNDIIAQQLTYTNAFDGGTMYQTYIPHGSSAIVIWYAGDSQLGEMFSRMLSTIRYSK